jgi:tryptophan halogenase
MTATLCAGDVPRVLSPFELAATPTGVALRSASDVLHLTGIGVDDLRRLLGSVDGRRTVAEIAGALSDEFDEESVVAALRVLSGSVVGVAPPLPGSERDVAAAEVHVLGSGWLARVLVRRLRAAGYLAAKRVDGRGDVTRSPAVVVCAREGVPYRSLLEAHHRARAERSPFLLVQPLLDGGLALGPLGTPDGPACPECAVRAQHDAGPGAGDLLDAFSVPTMGAAARSTAISAALDAVVDEVDAVLAGRGEPSLLATVEVRRPGGARQRTPVATHPRCTSCAAHPRRDGALDALSALDQVTGANGLARLQDPSIAAGPAQRPTEYRRICILGGGTAGYLTALSLRAARPDIEVTLVESSKIPVIGVGEATTTEIVPYLHHFLGIDAGELFREVQPTFKLGIKFDWGRPSEPAFHYPFDVGRPLEALLYDGHLRHVSLLGMMMDADRVPVLECGGRHVSLLGDYPFAYHLENRRLVAFLRRRAASVGVLHIDAEIVDAPLAADGEEIAALITDDGRRLEFDLYIDCSGFRSTLLEKKLRSPFQSYASSLFTDTAVVASVPHHGRIKPYTTAETMDSGWCWNIPQVEEDHRGYVFSSAFCSVDAAVEEMRRKNPEMGEPWTVRFRSGRHQHFWKGNVVAVGNAYGFVEPLESTAIQVIIVATQYLIAHLPAAKSETKPKELLNHRLAEYWDYIRWFLSVHYRFNRRKQTPFWDACGRDVDISGAQDIVDLFREGAPLVYKRGPNSLSRLTFDAFGYDILLFGQEVPAQRAEPREDARQFAARRAACKTLVARALPQREALEVLARDPELRARHVHDPRGWVTRYQRVMAAAS